MFSIQQLFSKGDRFQELLEAAAEEAHESVRLVIEIINTPSGMMPRRDENLIRSAAYAHSVCIMTTITGAQAALNGIKALKRARVGVRPIQKYLGNVVQV